MAGDPMNYEDFKDKLSSITLGTVMGAAARDYKNELLEQEKSRVAPTAMAWNEFDLDSLAEDPELERLQAKRLADLRKEREMRQILQQKGHGEYKEITEEEFLGEVTGSERCVVHFFHQKFERCKIMDKHMAILARKHFQTKFVKIDAQNCPFFTSKLAIKILPTVILFRNGVSVDRVVGFDDFGGKDDFSTTFLEKRMLKQGVILEGKKKEEEVSGENPSTVRTSHWNSSDSDSD